MAAASIMRSFFGCVKKSPPSVESFIYLPMHALWLITATVKLV